MPVEWSVALVECEHDRRLLVNTFGIIVTRATTKTNNNVLDAAQQLLFEQDNMLFDDVGLFRHGLLVERNRGRECDSLDSGFSVTQQGIVFVTGTHTTS